MTEEVKNKKPLIPKSIQPFIIRAVALFMGWKLLYIFLLRPYEMPDAQLTRWVQKGAVWLLSLFYSNVGEEGSSILLNGVKSVNIAHQCNGLELIVLYIGFILCIPTKFVRMVGYIVIGTIVIHALNVVRAAILADMYYKQHAMAHFAHHYAFKLVIYFVVFLGWMMYVKKMKKNEA